MEVILFLLSLSLSFPLFLQLFLLFRLSFGIFSLLKQLQILIILFVNDDLQPYYHSHHYQQQLVHTFITFMVTYKVNHHKLHKDVDHKLHKDVDHMDHVVHKHHKANKDGNKATQQVKELVKQQISELNFQQMIQELVQEEQIWQVKYRNIVLVQVYLFP